jgi:hypothetical protein
MDARTPRVRQLPRGLAVLVLCVLCICEGQSRAQEPRTPETIALERLESSIDRLGELDYQTRTTASRTIRRTPGEQAVPALLRTVSGHADGYVRYRALVLLTGFNDPRTKDAMRESLASTAEARPAKPNAASPDAAPRRRS